MKTLFLIAALAAVVPVLPAAAQAPERTLVVSYADLKVTAPAGRTTLTHRIRHAAEEVCGTASNFDLVGQNRLARCRVATVAAAEQEIARSLAARNGSNVLIAARN